MSPFSPVPGSSNARPQPVTADQALELVSPGASVFIHTGAAAPGVLVAALARRAQVVDRIEVTHLHTEGPAPYVEGELAGRVGVKALFVGGNMRQAVASGIADYVPVFLSEIPRMFRTGILRLDVALLHVSPPDRHGFCSLGISVDVAKAAAESARILIAQVNPRMPRTHGDGHIHISRFAATVDCDEALPEPMNAPIGDVERAIGAHTAELIPDGACLQLGIGSVPDAVAAALVHHRRLGIHTEMLSDGILGLVEAGAVTGEDKVTYPGQIVSGFIMGSRKLYDFVDDNPAVRLLDVGYVNDPNVIRRNPAVASVNSAIELDLTGQVCAESIGTRQFSGVGGQMDFMRGAALSEGGRPIIVLPSVTRTGASRIVSTLRPGAGVTTTRSHVHFVVTEYGIAEVHGRTLRQRARALIDVAHPDHREQLEREAFERYDHRV